ncbi:MAG: tetratricopeptide repeat protein [Ignavibacteriales bacterium]|nr:tetratricopeptide repeat protein [Ignavibacteriales bacterium]
MKKLLIPVLIVASVVVVLFFRSGLRKLEPVAISNELHPPETADTPSKENVNRSFVDHVDMLKKRLASDPNDIQTLKTLAQWLMDAHKTEEAIVYFERGIHLEPKNDSLLLDLSVCYFQIHQYDSAMKVTERILKYHPDHRRALLNQGSIFAAQNKMTDAARVWSRLIKRSPETEEARQAGEYLAQVRKK